LPEKIKSGLNINNFENDCEKVKFMADEYLHGELSEKDNDFIRNHIITCKECFDFIEKEKKYLEEIKLGEYIPEISVSQSVMDKIIENKIIIDKPPKRRFVPFGFITAAAVVVIMFIASRDGVFNIFIKNSDTYGIAENDAGNAAQNENAIFDDEAEIIFGAYDNDNDNDGEIQDDMANEAAERGIEENLLMYEYNNMYDEADYDKAAGDMDFNAAEPEIAAFILPEEESPAPAAEAPYDIIATEEELEAETLAAAIPPTVEESQFGAEMEEYISEISGLEMSEIYQFYYIGVINMPDEKREVITKDIEIYMHDGEHNMFDMFDKKYQDILEKNLIENNIEISEILIKYQDGGYIAVIYWSN